MSPRSLVSMGMMAAALLAAWGGVSLAADGAQRPASRQEIHRHALQSAQGAHDGKAGIVAPMFRPAGKAGAIAPMFRPAGKDGVIAPMFRPAERSGVVAPMYHPADVRGAVGPPC